MIERLWIRRILSGDEWAAERLVREHYPRVLKFLRHLTGSATDAEDLAQQTFLKAKEALPQFRGECSLSTWFHRIAYHEFTRLLRDRREFARPLPERGIDDSHRSEDAIVLDSALASLPDEMRMAFLLREVQGLSARETAEVLDIPEGTVRSRCHTARLRLREILEGTWEVANENKCLEDRNGTI